MDRPTQQIVDYAIALRYADLDDYNLHAIKRRLVDTVACALAAYPRQPAAVARALATLAVSNPPAHVPISGAPTTPDLAAYAGAFGVRYWDLNDTYLHGGHPSDTIPGILAIAETTNATGADTLLALTIAYETFCALSDAIGPVGTSAAGRIAIASAAGASRLLGLDGERMADAVSIAAVSTISQGIRGHGALTMWRAGQAGNAARNGIFAALTAQHGMGGPHEPFQTLGAAEQDELPSLGGRAAGSQLKAFPAEYHAQAAISAAIDLRRQIGLAAIKNIDSVVVHTYGHAVAGIGSDPSVWEASDIDTALHSMPFLVAAALVWGDAPFIEERHLKDTGVKRLMARTSVVEDPAITAVYHQTVATRVEITTVDGIVRRAECSQPLGHTANPFSDVELNAKFQRHAAGLLPPAQQARALQAMWSLGDLPGIAALLESLRVS